MRKLLFIAIFLVAIFGLTRNSGAEKIVVLYTGETHADLYPCHCPIEPFGGLARRASKVRELRKQFSDLLLLDSGGFFARGELDEYSLSSDLDQLRSRINLDALKLMGYDALAIGDEELTFGREFLEKEISRSRLHLLSSNVQIKGATAYLIKKVGAVKIGILGITPVYQAASNIQITDPLESIKVTVDKLRKQERVDLVILLSHLGEEFDTRLLQQVKIDFVISGHAIFGRDPETRLAEGTLLRPAWQGRKLGKLEIDWEKGMLKGYTVDLIGLGKDVPDDGQVKALLPECFSGKDCLRTGFKGSCAQAATKEAKCVFEGLAKIPVVVVTPLDCQTCNSEPFVNFLKNQFPEIVVSYTDEASETGKRFIRQFSVDSLPAYFIGKGMEGEANFAKIKEFAIPMGDYYWLNPDFTGVSYFINRKIIPQRLDLFTILTTPDTAKVLELTHDFLERFGKGFHFEVHFLNPADLRQAFGLPVEKAETEEEKRTLCINKHLPENFWQYIFCRANNVGSGWWEDCLKAGPEDLAKIKACARGEEGNGLIEENLKLTAELKIPYGPLFLINNKEIFGITAKTTAEELAKVIFKVRGRPTNQ